jgi:NhaC family Na+:H+ antiporter
VTVVIFLDKPLFIAIGATCIISVGFTKNKRMLPQLIVANTVSVSKTMLLMFLISITLPVLMAAGTLPTLIYHVSNLMVGHNLLLSAFVISTVLSMVLGSAIGTLTILLPLFSSIAFQSGIDYPILIGALISGVYIGDRCSPLSSGLHLLSGITETDFVSNMRLLLLSAAPPFLLSLAFFYFLGFKSLITIDMISSNALLLLIFDLHLWRLLPLVLMIVLLVVKQPITRVLTIVFLVCTAIALMTDLSLRQLPTLLWSGYASTVPELSAYIKTSGFKQMINVILVIFFSGVLGSILEADHLMGSIIAPFVKQLKTRRQLLFNTGCLSILLSMVTCSQAMTAMVSGKYMAPYFDDFKLKREFLVMMTANTGLNIVALIPWNVNGIMIKQLTSVSPINYFIFSVFVILLTLLTLFVYPVMIQKHLEHKRLKTSKL